MGWRQDAQETLRRRFSRQLAARLGFTGEVGCDARFIQVAKEDAAQEE